MAELVWSQHEKSGNELYNELANLFADSMHEKTVYIEDSMYLHLSFPNNEAGFDLYDPRKNKDGTLSIDIRLIVSGKTEWHISKDSMSMDELKRVLTTCYTRGFPRGSKSAYKWGSSAKGERKRGTPSVTIKTSDSLKPYQKRYIRAIANGVGEKTVTVISKVLSTTELRFDSKKPRFFVTEIMPNTDDSKLCHFFVEMKTNTRTLWHHACRDMSMTEFEEFMAYCGKNGFDINGVQWKWGTPIPRPGDKSGKKVSPPMKVDPNLYPHIKLYAGVLNNDRPEVVLLGKAILDGLQEHEGTIQEDNHNEFKITFPNKYAWVRLANVSCPTNDRFSFAICIFQGDKIMWQYSTTRMALDSVNSMISLYRRNGFTSDGPETFYWDGRDDGTMKVGNQWVVWDGNALGDVESFTEIADQIRYCLNEDSVNVKSVDDMHCWLTFEGRRAKFKLHDEGTIISKDRYFDLTMYDNVKIWEGRIVYSEMSKFVQMFSDCAQNGFPINDKQRYFWKTGRVGDEAEVKPPWGTAKITWEKHYVRMPSGTNEVATCIASALGESEATLSEVSEYEFDVKFPGRAVYFNLGYCQNNGDSTFSGKISLIIAGVADWKHTMQADSMGELYSKIKGFRDYGFPLDDGTKFMWDQKGYNPNKSYGNVQVNDDGLEDSHPEVVALARCIGDALGENRVTLRKIGGNDYKLSFLLHNNLLNLTNIGVDERNSLCSFSAVLYDGTKPVWKYRTVGTHLDSLHTLFVNNRANGFKYNGEVYYWEDKSAGGNDQSGDDEEQNMVGGAGVVNGDITSIRAVALKYDGKVVAFRLKTNLGSFDINRDVAARYGISDFKTEKFIKLQSVNGILMSESEQKSQTFVPDVSDNEADCFKLIVALFNS